MMHLNIKKGFESRINVVGIYRPPSGNPTSAIEKIEDKLNEIKQRFKGESIILGDFNIDLRDQHDKLAQKLTGMFNEHALTQVIDSVTRQTITQESMIFTDIKFINKTGVIEMNISDHFIIYLIKKKDRNGKNTKPITCRSFANFDLDLYKADLRLFNFDLVADMDVNTAWDLLWI